MSDKLRATNFRWNKFELIGKLETGTRNDTDLGKTASPGIFAMGSKKQSKRDSSSSSSEESDASKEGRKKAYHQRDRSRSRQNNRGDRAARRSTSRQRDESRHRDSSARIRTSLNPRRSRSRSEGRSVQRDRPRERHNQNYGRYDRRNDRQRDRRRRSKSFDHANAKWGKDDDSNKDKQRKNSENKAKPNFGLSGKLTEETNTYKGVVIKYSEPPEARKPRRRWRLYPFKGDKALQTLYIHRESAYLIGRDRNVVDLPVDHPSCSKQHAALQYRLVPFTRDDGSTGKRVRPYLIDLESANGTFINNKKIDPKKYVELLERDVIKFGFSSREYVMLHENSKDETMDDDVKAEYEEVKKELKLEKE
ncbi:smad nuclear-interacting protein 1-like [Euwallacea fornicatus]|uniref:smad nuclear-interacting protein 1-like n=1 Tax=Euwallacea fornicatus TaxID=995702 RepID=UPI00338EC36A